MGRAPCCDKNGLKKGSWTPEEDHKLTSYVQMHGPGNWSTLPKNAGLQRCGKSCRLRWTNYLRPDIKRGRFSFEEEETIIQLHGVLGNKWSAIAGRLPGRTDNEIKNHWNTHIRKRLLRNGINPVTHAPHLDFLDLPSILSSALCNPLLLNLSSFLRTQAALLNPDLLRLATTLDSLKQENPGSVLQQLQEKLFFNSMLQNCQVPLSQFDQFQNPFQENPACNASNAQISKLAQLMPTNTEGFSSSFSSLAVGCQNSLENLQPSSSKDSLVSQPNYAYGTRNPTVHEFPENSGYQNFGTGSVFSTPLSGPAPLNSSSTFVNSSSSAEDERENHCCSLLKFEIPESLAFADFM